MQPDVPNASCCGEADAYWADEVHVKDGKTYAVITDDRPDEPRGRPHVDIGTEIEIPNNKLYASYRQVLFPAAGMARKVIVAGLNVTVLAVVGAPAIGGSSSPGSSANGRPFSQTAPSRKLAASKV